MASEPHRLPGSYRCSVNRWHACLAASGTALHWYVSWCHSYARHCWKGQVHQPATAHPVIIRSLPTTVRPAPTQTLTTFRSKIRTGKPPMILCSIYPTPCHWRKLLSAALKAHLSKEDEWMLIDALPEWMAVECRGGKEEEEQLKAHLCSSRHWRTCSAPSRGARPRATRRCTSLQWRIGTLLGPSVCPASTHLRRHLLSPTGSCLHAINCINWNNCAALGSTVE
jgi:hypothetical protein